MGDSVLIVIAIIPFIFMFTILTLFIVLIVKLLKWLPQRGNGAVLQKVVTDSVHYQKEALQQQSLVLEEMTDVNFRLVNIEKILQEVE
ncbi:hypothetical protein [Sporosarcina sp. FA9]|uniref:hypothetical protein n=1 Tax=Sporosarcina sp. FA9 TaxID=3413030 RepID=UPI003F65F0E9